MVCLLIAIALFFLSVWGLIYSIIHSDDLYHIILVNTVMILMVIALLLFLWLYVLRKDLFCHTYYPIRFNRKTRMVYVYREERDGGILRLPWNEGFYHIGRGLADKDIIDLRCHVLDGDTVKDTFAIGMPFHTRTEDRIRGLWEQIRTYMDEGAKAAKPDFIYLSMKPTWKDAYLSVGAKFHAYNIILHILFAPLMYPLIVTRWLVMKTCKQPNWPEDIEHACKVEKDDPQELPLPEYYCQLAVEHYDEHNLW